MALKLSDLTVVQVVVMGARGMHSGRMRRRERKSLCTDFSGQSNRGVQRSAGVRGSGVVFLFVLVFAFAVF